MARVPYLHREDAGEANQALYDRLEKERKVPTANIFLALANAPEQLDGFLTYANALRGSELSPKLRELAILAVGYATGSQYEIAHHQSHGLKAGISPEQLAAVADFETAAVSDEPVFDEAELAVMRLAKESTLHVAVAEDVWKAVAAHLTYRQLTELALTIGWYNSGVRLMVLLDIELEDGYAAVPPAAR